MSRMKHSAMSEGVLDQAIKKLKLKKPSQNTVPAKAALLKGYFLENTAKDDISVCSNCQGESDFNLESCPYCGDTGKVGEEADAITTTGTDSNGPSTELLDEAVASFKQKKRNAEVSIWELGADVARIHDGDLWKTRTLGSEPQYKTFKAFCGVELGISHTHAYTLIEVSKKFTREQVEQIGVSKLSIIVSLPPDKQAAALNGAKDKSKRDLQAEADAAKGKSKAVPDQVTIMARANSRTKLPMLGTNTKGKPAKSLADEPFCEEEHDNGIISRYAIKIEPKTGNLLLIVSRRRA